MIKLITLIACAVLGLSLNTLGESEGGTKPVTDAAATGIWLQSLFTINEGQLRVCQKPLEQSNLARIPLAAKSEVQILGNGILINQEGLYPMFLGSAENRFSMYMGTPFYVFLDYADGISGLEGYAKNPKEAAMNHAGFRVIGEALHAHFTKLAQDNPEWHRVIDEILYPSEHYIWKIGDIWIMLSANNGNDNDGIRLTLTKDDKEIEKIRKMKRTDKAVYADWGNPMPHKKSEQVSEGQPASRSETESENKVKPQSESEEGSR